MEHSYMFSLSPENHQPRGFIDFSKIYNTRQLIITTTNSDNTTHSYYTNTLLQKEIVYQQSGKVIERFYGNYENKCLLQKEILYDNKDEYY